MPARAQIWTSLPGPPSKASWIALAWSAEASRTSLPASPLIASVSLAGSALTMLTVAARPVTRGRAVASRGDDRVVAVGAVDDDAVGLGVAGGAAGGSGEIDAHVDDVGSGEVVDVDRVGSAEGVEDDRLDVVRVHRDVGHVAEEPEAVAVRRQVDALGGAGAVEAHRVDAGLAFEGVAAVARIPDERVVARAHQRHVVAAVAVDGVVAVAAEQRLDAPATGEGVVAGAAVERQADRVGRERGGRDRVVAAEAVDDERVGRLLVLDRDLRGQAGDGDARGVAARRRSRRCRSCR